MHGTASAASSRAFARLGAKRSAGLASSAQAVAVPKATRSIDEMDMDPAHVTFASSDELARGAFGCLARAARPSRLPRGGGAVAVDDSHRETRCRASRSTLPPAGLLPRLGSARAPSARVVSGACFVSSPALGGRGAVRETPSCAWTRLSAPALPARGPRAPRRRASRARHDEAQRTRLLGLLGFRPGARACALDLRQARLPARVFSRSALFLVSKTLVALSSSPSARPQRLDGLRRRRGRLHRRHHRARDGGHGADAHEPA